MANVARNRNSVTEKSITHQKWNKDIKKCLPVCQAFCSFSIEINIGFMFRRPG